MDRVLVVDGEPGIRGLMARWAELLGCTPVEAADAGRAIEVLARTPCDVVVCDAHLPGRDGLWLARRIREDYPEAAVVLATDTQDLGAVVGGLRAGIVDCLVKPFGLERFREAIECARRRHREAAGASRWRRSIELEIQARRRQLGDALACLDLASDAAVKGALSLVTVRDRPACEHALRVAALSVDVAARLGLSEAEAGDLERAALVHEIPRTVIPETVLWKAGDLSADEWAILKREPEIAHEVFHAVPFLAAAADILRAARERHDGTGYPQGLAGDAIPAGARLLAVADAYDTMVRPQGHREPLTPSEAAAEIAAASGTQFDPRTAEALLDSLGHAAPPAGA